MAKITFKGEPIVETSGELPAVGSKAPNFSLIATDLSSASLNDFSGKRVVLNIFPSIDTPVCAASVRHFNKDASGLDNTVVLCISTDMPFAQKRFCGSEGLDQVQCLSTFRDRKANSDEEFANAYGVKMTSGPLMGMLARSVVVIDGDGVVKHTEMVPEVAQEPNYQAALAALS